MTVWAIGQPAIIEIANTVRVIAPPTVIFTSYIPYSAYTTFQRRETNATVGPTSLQYHANHATHQLMSVKHY